MGAISSVFWTFLNAGDVVIASNRVYGCTYALLAHQLTRFGIKVEFVDFTDLQEVKKVAKTHGKIAMLYTESIQNPTNDVVDLEELAAIAHAHQAKFVVDNTFASPIGCNPLLWGADVVVHSATKYLMGGTYVAGCAMGTKKDMDLVRFTGVKDCTGAVLDAVMAFVMLE